MTSGESTYTLELPYRRSVGPVDRGYGFGNAIRGWRPTGQPDVPPDAFKDHVL